MEYLYCSSSDISIRLVTIIIIIALILLAILLKKKFLKVIILIISSLAILFFIINLDYFYYDSYDVNICSSIDESEVIVIKVQNHF